MSSSKLTWQWMVYEIKDEYRSRYTEYGTQDEFWYTHLELCDSFNVEDHAIRWLEEHAELGKEYTIIKIYTPLVVDHGGQVLI